LVSVSVYKDGNRRQLFYELLFENSFQIKQRYDKQMRADIYFNKTKFARKPDDPEHSAILFFNGLYFG